MPDSTAELRPQVDAAAVGHVEGSTTTRMHASNPLLDAAIRYAEMGYRVFPLIPGIKKPITENGFHDASQDVAKIDQWWRETPNANIGIPTQGLLVLDIDGKDNPWLSDRPDLQADYATARMAYTPRGGRHLIWKQPTGVDVRNSESDIADKIDIRANGGYIAVAPSVTRDGKYRWAESLELDCSPEQLAEAPSWLVRLAIECKQKRSTSDYPTNGNAIPEGRRNSTLTSLAGTMRRPGMSVAEIDAALQKVNLDRCKPPLDAAEVSKIARSIGSRAPDASSVASAESERSDETVPQVSAIRSVRELCSSFPTPRPVVIEGVLRKGETLNIIAAPKTGKSWLVTDLAIAVATGRPWLERFATTRGRVLLIDNELHAETTAKRIPEVAKARGISQEEFCDDLSVYNIRGQLRDILSLGDFFDDLKPEQFSIIVLDAFYRFLPPRSDENDNGLLASIYNHIDRYADRLGCSFVLIHHSSKGNQSAKSVTDVGAGAGSQSRAADTHLVLRPHEEPRAVVVEAAARSFAPIEPAVLRWEFPVWVPAPDLDPTKLQSQRPKKERKVSSNELQVEPFVKAFLTAEPQTRAQIEAAASAQGISKRGVGGLIQAASASQKIFEWYTGSNQPLRYAVVPPPREMERGTAPARAQK
ncbi:MAG: bifunctional DNA primase/polymerase [Fimbriimonadaceae bacterium]|nr:bifunctional DNA primase/polymerase [Fimbriimonadaceae bacterium]